MIIDSRGDRTRAALVSAAIEVVAAEGLAALSYRKVASAAEVSLALVNYHFPAKSELLAALSGAILHHYTSTTARAIERARSDRTIAFGHIAYRLLCNATSRDREQTLAWAEINLEAARHAESLTLSREWDDELQTLWTALAVATDHDATAVAVRFETDLLIGMLFLCLALKLDGANLTAGLEDIMSDSPHSPQADSTKVASDRRTSRKSAETRARIIEAAIDVLKEHGPAAMSFRAISERTGFSMAVPSYQFGSIEHLLSSVQVTMIERSRMRYREVMQMADRDHLSEEQLLDLTTTIFVREATQSSLENLAFFANWIEAARRPELRPVVRSFVRSQILAWQRVLSAIGGSGHSEQSGFLAIALFIGKLVRVISTGSMTSDLATVRQEFRHGLRNIAKGRTIAGLAEQQ